MSVVRTSRMEDGASANVSRLELGSHTGTHVDAPCHFEPGGSSVDKLALEALIGPVRVIELDAAEKISTQDIERANMQGVRRVIFKTRNCRAWDGIDMRTELSGPADVFRRDYVYLSPDAAQWLVDHSVFLVGVDYLSVERFGDASFSTHHILLRAGVVILEGLNPSMVPPGDYELIALPLRIAGCDGAPARVVLRTAD